MAPSFEDLCRQAVVRGREVLGFDRLGLWFCTDEPLVVEGSFGTDESGNVRDERSSRITCFPGSDMGRLLAETQPLVHVGQAILYDDHSNPVGQGAHLLASLWDGQSIIGCLSADDLLHQHEIGAPENELLRMYSMTLGHLCTRRRAEDSLRTSRDEQRKLLEIVDRSPAMVVRWEAGDERRIDFVSRTVSQLGYSVDDFMRGHETWMNILHPDDRPRLQREIEQHRDRAGNQRVQRYRLRAAGGDYRWCEGHHRVTTDASGKVMYIEGIFLDVTERHELELLVAKTSQRERAALGAALHDSLGQELAGLAFMAAAAAKCDEDCQEEIRNSLASISSVASNAVAHVRRIARGLAPVDVSGEGLAAAISELAEGTSELYGLACHFDLQGPGVIHDTTTADNLYYIAVESVNNAVRHGTPSRIRIHLDTRAAGALSIRDNGTGFDPRVRYDGLGLHLLHHRAEIIGGVLALSSTADGTLVACRFPNVA